MNRQCNSHQHQASERKRREEQATVNNSSSKQNREQTTTKKQQAKARNNQQQATASNSNNSNTQAPTPAIQIFPQRNLRPKFYLREGKGKQKVFEHKGLSIFLLHLSTNGIYSCVDIFMCAMLRIDALFPSSSLTYRVFFFFQNLSIYDL